MFQDTRPADLDSGGTPDAYAEFRVSHASERLALLRELRDGSVPVILNAPDGSSMTTALWAMDDARDCLNFSADTSHPQLARLVDADEVVAVAYLESVKLQFDLPGLVLVRGASASALQCGIPREIYRFQRRHAYRVRMAQRQSPKARFRHPSMPEMQLALRVLDVSAGGCALWLPQDVPPLQAGTQLAEVRVELDELTRFSATLMLQHVTVLGTGQHDVRDVRDVRDGRDGRGVPGVRIGCAWQPLSGPAERTLQLWIEQAQKRRRMLSLG